MLVAGVTRNVGDVGWMKTHTAPNGPSPGPPTIAVLPSPDSETELPWRSSSLVASLPTSLLPFWVQTPLLRV